MRFGSSDEPLYIRIVTFAFAWAILAPVSAVPFEIGQLIGLLFHTTEAVATMATFGFCASVALISFMSTAEKHSIEVYTLHRRIELLEAKLAKGR